MAQVSGQVSQVKEKQTQFGPMYDVIINGQSYGAGKYPPRDIKAGDFVSLEFEQKGNFRNVVKGSLRKDDGAAAAAPPVTADTPKSQYAGKAPYVPFDERQEMISKQSALNTALSFCNLASANGAVPMPKSAKESEKLGLIYQWVLDTAGGLYKLSTGRVWDMPEGEAPAGIEKPAAKPRATKAVSEDTQADTGYSEYGE